MLKPAANILLGYLGKGALQSIPEFSCGMSFKAAQVSLDFGNAFFNRLEVGRVSRQWVPPCPGCLNQRNGAFVLMRRNVIPQNEIPGAQFRDEPVFDLKLQPLAINCAVDPHWSTQALPGQRADNRNVRASRKGFHHCRPLAAWSASVGTRHRQMEAEFINEPQSFARQRQLLFPKGRALFRAGFSGAPGLLLSVKSSCCTARQTVFVQTLTRQRRRNNSRNSSSVASGNSASSSAIFSSFVSSSLAFAPPPCGCGVRSPVSRRSLSSL